MKELSQKKAQLLLCGFIFLVSLAVYANALPNGFIYDDHSQVLKNYLIRDIRNIPEIFRRSAWTFEGAPPTSNYYRPMLNLLYMLDYYIFGLEPWGYHLVNLLFHAGNSVLVFVIASSLPLKTVNSEKLEVRRTDPGNSRVVDYSLFTSHYSRFVAFIAALLFATHPVHVEAVTWIAGLPDVSFAFFYLLSFYLYMLSAGSFRWKYLFSVIFFLLAVLCKEPGLTLPAVLIVYDFAFKKGLVWSRDNLKRYAPYLLVAVCYFVVRSFVLGGFTPLTRIGRLSTFQYVINIFPLFSQYLQKLLLPANLNFWPVFNPLSSLFSEEGVLSLFVAAAYAGAMIMALRKNRAVFFSLALILLPLLPAFYIKGIIGKPFADRYLYLPSFGFVMLMALLFSRAKERLPGLTRVYTIILALLIGVYAVGTISRNSVWKDEYTLFADTVKKSPDSVVPRLEYGNALLAKGRFDEAIEQFQAAMRMEPMLYVIYHHLGLAFAGKGRVYDAIGQYKIALELNPYGPGIHADLARAYAKAGFRSDAVKEFQISLQMQPTAENHNLLGIAYAQNGQIPEAVGEFNTANSLDPAQGNYSRNLAEALELERSRQKEGQAVFSGKYEERTMKNSEIFNFAW